ncbi:MAG: ABC transporter permease, partial [Planctomycetota bacterium]
MALRLLRARKINIISIVGVMLGVASIIVVLSVMDGFQRELRAMIRGTLSDLIIELDPRENASYRAIKKAVEDVEGVEAVTLQRHAFGLLPAKTRDTDGERQNYLPVRVVGIIPEDEQRVSNVFEYMQEAGGQPDDPFDVKVDWFIPEEMPRIVISDWFARRVGRTMPLQIGEVITLLSVAEVTEEGAPKYVSTSRDVVVSRIYSSGNSEYDRYHVYVDLTKARQYFFSTDEATISELRVKLDNYERASDLRHSVALALEPFDPDIAAMPEWRIETWEERQRNLLRAVDNEKFLLAFVLFFITIVACFTIFATLTMTVVEKTREIGVLRALGATPS